jgi:hypothetical protein
MAIKVTRREKLMELLSISYVASYNLEKEDDAYENWNIKMNHEKWGTHALRCFIKKMVARN